MVFVRNLLIANILADDTSKDEKAVKWHSQIAFNGFISDDEINVFIL